jgi:protein gp37
VDLVRAMHGGEVREPADPAGRIHWVIAGGESGPGARPAHPDWFRSVRDQCQAAGVPFFFKQWGEWSPYQDGQGNMCRRFKMADVPNGLDELAHHRMFRQGKQRAGRLLDGRTWDELPKEAAHAH